MPENHSEIYHGLGLRAYGHRARLNTILRQVSHFGLRPGATFCDLGCSNGFITEQIRAKLALRATGMDHVAEHFELGHRLYPSITFKVVDLNEHYLGQEQYDLVTCFEALEHVGKLPNGIQNVTARIRPGGFGLISVPIERGARGIMKYLVKKAIGGYTTKELRVSEAKYFKTLLSSERISSLRPDADGYGTHFGFDYRDVDDCLTELCVKYEAFNSGTSRLYRIYG
jgi:2-polyprenyl-3-methyl-5-hydroxy-6-metoxy-1,4-benzoquinol methylase